MNENVKIVFGLLGGLALFLYGMNGMSDALQKTAGDKMKKILSFLTKNPIMGALAGALVTAVLQSSSATTVMVIGFVSAGLMSLPQAISVIFGANIGTTMTAQLMAFKISDYIYPLIFIGFMMNFVYKCNFCGFDGKGKGDSDSWRGTGNDYDTCCTEQFCNNCRTAEFCSSAGTGWCDERNGISRCNSDPSW